MVALLAVAGIGMPQDVWDQRGLTAIFTSHETTAILAKAAPLSLSYQ